MNGRWVCLVLLVLIAITPVFALVPVADAQEFPHVEASKKVTPQRVLKDGTLQVTILLRGAGGSVRTPVDVVLIIDKSGSMSGKKITDAKEAAKAFLGFLNDNDRAGLVTFSSTVQSDLSLTSMSPINMQALKKKIDLIQAVGATDMYDAIVAANNMLLVAPRSNAPLVVVLLTDGNHNFPSTLSDSTFQDLANQAKSKGIIIYTIGLGSDASTDRLRMIANTTGGTYYFAATSDELKSIYEAIGMTLAFAGTDINVTETVPSFLTYDNDASKQPSVTTSGGATILSWHVGTLKVGEEWQVTYTAKAQKGVEAVSTVSQCKVEYKTSASASALLNLTPGIVFHDIAVTTLKAVPGSTSKGGIIALQIGAKNNGPSRETFDLRTTYDGSILDSRIVVLEIGQSTLITINWNTSNVDPGKYKLTTEADPEQKLWDANRSDNSATTNVEILGPSGVSIFLIFMIILITTVAGAGVAYGSSRLIHSTYRKPRKLRSPYLCTVDGSPLKSTYMGKVWYCPACGKNYEFN